MIFVTMKAHVRRSRKPLLILGMDTERAVTIDEDGNLRGYSLRSLKAPALEAQLRMALDSKGVGLMLTSVTAGDEDDFGIEVSK